MYHDKHFDPKYINNLLSLMQLPKYNYVHVVSWTRSAPCSSYTNYIIFYMNTKKKSKERN